MPPALLVVAGVLGIVVLVAAIFQLTARMANQRAERVIAASKLVCRSGRQWMTIRLRNYRGTEVTIANSLSKKGGEVVLTEKALVLFTPYTVSLGEEDLSAVEVKVSDGEVHLHSKKPPAAQGEVEVTFPAENVASWVDALRARGARVM